MAERKNIAAWTAPSCPYPPYVSINRDGDEVEITVRSPVIGGLHEGVTATVRLPWIDYIAMFNPVVL